MTKQEREISGGIDVFTPPERRTLSEIARHRVTPGLMSRALRSAGRPLEKAMKDYFRLLPSRNFMVRTGSGPPWRS